MTDSPSSTPTRRTSRCDETTTTPDEVANDAMNLMTLESIESAECSSLSLRACFNVVAADVRRRRFGQLSSGNPPPHVGGYGVLKHVLRERARVRGNSADEHAP